jgi:hypothetical protein
MTPPAAPAPDEVDLDPLAASDDAEHAMSPYLRRIALVMQLEAEDVQAGLEALPGRWTRLPALRLRHRSRLVCAHSHWGRSGRPEVDDFPGGARRDRHYVGRCARPVASHKVSRSAALVGALAAGWLSDRFGRKKVLLGSSILFTLGAVEQAAAQIPKELILGRGIVGLGVVS